MTMISSGNYERLYAGGGTVTSEATGFRMSRPRVSRVALSVDIGGTFTDAVVEDGDQYYAVKVLSTPRDPAAGFIEGALRALKAGGRRPEDVRVVMHGTTLATNAILERRGAKTALLTTEGFRDVLEIGDEGRHDQYDISMEKTRSLIPRHLRLTVRQRHRSDGSEAVPLDEKGVVRAAAKFRAAGVQSVVVGFLHSHVNGSHEERAASILRVELPGVHVCTSSSVCPEIREYERFSTAAANAYVRPLLSEYMTLAERRLYAAGIVCPMLVMTSGGGLTDLHTAAALPVRLIESGPAGGAMLAQWAAKEVHADRVLSFDMGGTTAKVCFLEGGRAAAARDFEVDRAARFRQRSGLPVRIPCIDLVEISGGGGSIARTSAVGAVTVGPDSAGAEPGPACYGRGGKDVTVTDADLILGHIDPAAFACGEVCLQPALASAALKAAVADPQRFASEAAAAHAIVEMVDETMANAARMKAAEHGRELDGHVIVAFGGAAPLHAARVAEKLGLDTVLVPPNAGVGSAVGFLSAPLAFEAVKSRPMRLSAFDAPVVNQIFRGLYHETVAPLAAGAARYKPGLPARESKRAYARYVGQGHEVALDLPTDDLGPNDAALLRDRFEQAYARQFARGVPGGEIEVLTWVLSLVLASDPMVGGRSPWVSKQATQAAKEAGPPAKRARLVYDGATGRMTEVVALARAELAPGACILGPAVIVEAHTSTVVPRAFECTVLANGFLRLDRRAGHAAVARRMLTVGGALPSATGEGCGTGEARLRLQVMWARLLAAAEEQAEVLFRTAFAPAVRESGYLACAIFDRECRMLAQGAAGTPGLANSLAEVCAHFLVAFPLQSLLEGDALVTNDPWLGTGSLNDFTVVPPVFWRGAAVGFVASSAHLTDVGGSDAAAAATDQRQDVHMEGLRVLPTHLARGGVVDEALIRILRSNVRQPDESVGDLYALLACNGVGSARVSAMLEEFNADDLEALSSHIVEASRAAVVRNIAALPRGEWSHETIVEDASGPPLRLAARVRIEADAIHVDFGGTGPPSARGLNVPPAYTRAYTAFALACLVAHDVPKNAGTLSAFHISAPRGCVLHAEYPRATSARHAIGQLLPDLVLGCLADCLPERVPAEGASVVCRMNLAGGSGGDAGHAAFAVTALENGGMGARPHSDGLSSTSFPSGVRCTPVEVVEALAPVLFRRKELRAGSGGAGRHRGGLGLRLEVESTLSGASSSQGSGGLTLLATLGRRGRPAEGRHGGKAGATAGLRRSDGVACASGGALQVPSGVRVVLETAGGGGFGPARERPRAAVRADVLDGLISAAEAQRDYGLSGA